VENTTDTSLQITICCPVTEVSTAACSAQQQGSVQTEPSKLMHHLHPVCTCVLACCHVQVCCSLASSDYGHPIWCHWLGWLAGLAVEAHTHHR
jgi:hypothetical protein